MMRTFLVHITPIHATPAFYYTGSILPNFLSGTFHYDAEKNTGGYHRGLFIHQLIQRRCSGWLGLAQMHFFSWHFMR